MPVATSRLLLPILLLGLCTLPQLAQTSSAFGPSVRLSSASEDAPSAANEEAFDEGQTTAFAVLNTRARRAVQTGAFSQAQAIYASILDLANEPPRQDRQAIQAWLSLLMIDASRGCIDEAWNTFDQPPTDAPLSNSLQRALPTLLSLASDDPDSARDHLDCPQPPAESPSSPPELICALLADTSPDAAAFRRALGDHFFHDQSVWAYDDPDYFEARMIAEPLLLTSDTASFSEPLEVLDAYFDEIGAHADQYRLRLLSTIAFGDVEEHRDLPDRPTPSELTFEKVLIDGLNCLRTSEASCEDSLSSLDEPPRDLSHRALHWANQICARSSADHLFELCHRSAAHFHRQRAKPQAVERYLDAVDRATDHDRQRAETLIDEVDHLLRALHAHGEPISEFRVAHCRLSHALHSPSTPRRCRAALQSLDHPDDGDERHQRWSAHLHLATAMDSATAQIVELQSFTDDLRDHLDDDQARDLSIEAALHLHDRALHDSSSPRLAVTTWQQLLDATDQWSASQLRTLYFHHWKALYQLEDWTLLAHELDATSQRRRPPSTQLLFEAALQLHHGHYSGACQRLDALAHHPLDDDHRSLKQALLDEHPSCHR